VDFEWDSAKAKTNRRKHGVSFEEGRTIFGPAKPEIFQDEAHSDDELRFIAIGFSERSRLLTVAFTRRELTIRIVSVRRATRREVKLYAKAKDQKG